MTDLLPWGVLGAARLAPFLLISPWLEPLARTLRTPLLVLLGAFTLSLPKGPLPSDAAQWLALLGGEFLLGCIIAVTFALPFYAFRWVGDLAESLRGAPRSQLPGAQSDSALSFFFHLATLAVFASMGGLVMLLEALYRYTLRYPLGQPWRNDALNLEGALLLLADTFALMVRAGAPLLAAALLLEIVLALVARTAPQIPVFFLALPARSLAVLSVAAIALGTTLMMVAGAIGETLVVP